LPVGIGLFFKLMLKSKYGDSLVELDARVGHLMDKVRELGIGDNTLIIFTTDCYDLKSS